MPNMGYRRWRNTLSDVRDCFDSVREGTEVSSPEEARAMHALVMEALDFLGEFDVQTEDDAKRLVNDFRDIDAAGWDGGN